uniref:Uncharacterized protein n=1 Tax=Anguilla anguilla TaxID=7936 RepID=A0A0E9WDB4_ANGAN
MIGCSILKNFLLLCFDILMDLDSWPHLVLDSVLLTFPSWFSSGLEFQIRISGNCTYCFEQSCSSFKVRKSCCLFRLQNTAVLFQNWSPLKMKNFSSLVYLDLLCQSSVEKK